MPLTTYFATVRKCDFAVYLLNKKNCAKRKKNQPKNIVRFIYYFFNGCCGSMGNLEATGNMNLPRQAVIFYPESLTKKIVLYVV